jgi:cob(I)alamin adenosyltransferase
MTTESLEQMLEVVVSGGPSESDRVNALIKQAAEQQKPLFFARFLTDIPATWSDAAVDLLRHAPHIALRQYGQSCYVNACPPLDEVARAEIGLDESETALRSGQYDMVLLDHILTAVQEHLLSLEDIERLVKKRPPHVRLILTGCDIPPDLAAAISNASLSHATLP